MIKIDTEEHAAQITDDQLPDVDFNYLLKTYQRIEFESVPGSLFVVLLCLMGLIKNDHPFTVSWIIENIGSPDYVFFEEGRQENGDLFYCFAGDVLVGHIRIRDKMFDGFGTVEKEHFETVCLPLDTWRDSIERLRPEH
ncbi:hypothetical protein BVX99_03505 [bacterium F16]|nr:hypothetical protein BVX99_03505 [bacterium F16]